MWNWRELWIWELKELMRKKLHVSSFNMLFCMFPKKIHVIRHVDLRYVWCRNRFIEEIAQKALTRPQTPLRAPALLIRVWGPVWNLGVMNSFRIGAMKARFFGVFWRQEGIMRASNLIYCSFPSFSNSSRDRTFSFHFQKKIQKLIRSTANKKEFSNENLEHLTVNGDGHLLAKGPGTLNHLCYSRAVWSGNSHTHNKYIMFFIFKINILYGVEHWLRSTCSFSEQTVLQNQWQKRLDCAHLSKTCLRKKWQLLVFSDMHGHCNTANPRHPKTNSLQMLAVSPEHIL